MRLQALDGWRGIACLLVAIHHLPVPHALYYQSWLQSGAPMLELFFLISGFVISLVFSDMAQRPRGALAFIVRVLGRLWPIHMIMLAALVALMVARSAFAEHGGFGDRMSLESLAAQLLLIQTWVGQGLTWNYPAWTLSAELVAYLLFAVLMVFTKSRAGRIIGACALGLAAGVVFLGELGPREHYNVISVARVVTGFFIGFLLREIWLVRPFKAGPWTASALEFVAVIGVIWTLSARLDGPAYFLNYAIFGLVVYVFAADSGLISRVMQWTPLQWLGKASFSIYMIHGVISLYLIQAFWAAERFTGVQFHLWAYSPYLGREQLLFSAGGGWANDFLLLLYLVLVLSSAALLYRFVEGPTRDAAALLSKRVAQGGSIAADQAGGQVRWNRRAKG